MSNGQHKPLVKKDYPAVLDGGIVVAAIAQATVTDSVNKAQSRYVNRA